MKDALGHGSDARGGQRNVVQEQNAIRRGIDARHFPPRSAREMVRVSVTRPIGFRMADIGPGGKEFNVKTNSAWDKTYGLKGGTPIGAPARPGASFTAAHQSGVSAARATPRSALNAHGQSPATAKQVRASLRMARKFQTNKPPSQRRSYP